MAYKSDMKKINLALSSKDLKVFNEIKSVANIKLDSECVRFCIRNTYVSLSSNNNSYLFYENLLGELDQLKSDLMKLLCRS